MVATVCNRRHRNVSYSGRDLHRPGDGRRSGSWVVSGRGARLCGMPDLIYSAIASLDGFLADEQGSFDWAVPDEQVHAFVNDQQRTTGTHLYGRRTYELMIGWETMPPGDPVADDFASIWRAADKIVYSTTLAEVSTPRTRLEPVFDPVAVARLKQQAERNLVIGGPTLAAAAFAA